MSPIYINNNRIESIYTNNQSIGKVYVGDVLVFQKNIGIQYPPPAWLFYEGQIGLDSYGFEFLPYDQFYGNDNYGNFGSFGIIGGMDTINNDVIGITASRLNNTIGTFSISTLPENRPTTSGYAVRAVRPLNVNDGTYVIGTIISNAYTDIDGNQYDGIMIGSRVWTSTYIKTSKFSDGTLIPDENANFSTRTEAKRHVISYPSGYEITYYNGMAITGNQGIKTLISSGSDGWRIPTSSDFYDLRNTIGLTNAHILKSTRINEY